MTRRHHAFAVRVIYHIIIWPGALAKKVAISITVDGELLHELDDYVREIQADEIRKKRELSTRSSVIERFILGSLRGTPRPG